MFPRILKVQRSWIVRVKPLSPCEFYVPVKIGDLIAVIGDENYQYEKQLKEQLEEITCPRCLDN